MNLIIVPNWQESAKTTLSVIPTAAEMMKHSGLPHFIADLNNS